MKCQKIAIGRPQKFNTDTGEIWTRIWAIRTIQARAEGKGSGNINRTRVAPKKNADACMFSCHLFLSFPYAHVF